MIPQPVSDYYILALLLASFCYWVVHFLFFCAKNNKLTKQRTKKYQQQQSKIQLSEAGCNNNGVNDCC